jgi:hypothetical protein
MAKLDDGKKVALLLLFIVAISMVFMHPNKPSETTTTAPATPVQPPAAAPAAAAATEEHASATPAPSTVPSTASTPTPESVPAAAASTSPAVAPEASPEPVKQAPEPVVETPKEIAADVTANHELSREPVLPVTTTTESKTPSDKLSVEKSSAKRLSVQNHYVLSGLMPDGKCVTFNSYWTKNCQEGQSCIQITYDTACSTNDQGWAGAYWLNPANNWGSQKGGYTLAGVKKLVFWAKGKRGGEVIDTFKVGGIVNAKYPDSDSASIGPVTLTKNWKEYTIDLSGKDLSYIVGGFAWAANAHANAKAITFYLDNIYYE